MSEYYYHCVSSAQKFGGQPEDYLEVHRYLDRFKAAMPDFRHRAMTHHSEGIWEAIRFFGDTIEGGKRGSPEAKRYLYRGGNATRANKFRRQV